MSDTNNHTFGDILKVIEEEGDETLITIDGFDGWAHRKARLCATTAGNDVGMYREVEASERYANDYDVEWGTYLTVEEARALAYALTEIAERVERASASALAHALNEILGRVE